MPLSPSRRAARQALLQRAVQARAALVAVRDASPHRLEVADVERWRAAQEAARPALSAFQATRSAMPLRDRLARRLAREWLVAAEMLLWHGWLGFQTAEDVAFSYLKQLPEDRCPRSAPNEVRQMTNAAILLVYGARPI